MVVAGGMTATPEGIAELERKRVQMEKATRPPPSRAFATLLRKPDPNESEEEQLSEKEKKRRALPKKGPKPALTHPALREVFGRDEDSDEEVVIKG